MATNALTVTATGASTAIPVNLARFHYGIGIVVTLSTGGSATYDVEVTGDDPADGFTHWNKHDVLQNKSASANSNLAYPVTGVRIKPSALSGSLTLAVIQADG